MSNVTKTNPPTLFDPDKNGIWELWVDGHNFPNRTGGRARTLGAWYSPVSNVAFFIEFADNNRKSSNKKERYECIAYDCATDVETAIPVEEFNERVHHSIWVPDYDSEIGLLEITPGPFEEMSEGELQTYLKRIEPKDFRVLS